MTVKSWPGPHSIPYNPSEWLRLFRRGCPLMEARPSSMQNSEERRGPCQI